MSVLETVLVFAGIPLAGVLVLSVLIYVVSEKIKNRDRYRPGKPWNHEPVWYLPHVGAVETSHGDRHAELESGQAKQAALHAVGGASGEW